MVEKLRYAYRSEPGPVRDSNEDFVAALVPTVPDDAWPQGVLFGVADGMGGHAAGEVASRTALEAAFDAWRTAGSNPTKGLRIVTNAANLAVFDSALANPAQRGMGTTLTLLTLAGNEAFLSHVGDSRAYLFREGEAHQLTTDHSRVMEMLKMRLITPEQAKSHPARSQLTRSLGADPIVQPELNRVPIRRNDVLLLCSDGLWDVVSRADMARAVGAAPSDAAEGLIETAVKRGAPDNVSVLVVQITSALPIPIGPRSVRRGLFRRG